jgi:hypothetical protein
MVFQLLVIPYSSLVESGFYPMCRFFLPLLTVDRSGLIPLTVSSFDGLDGENSCETSHTHFLRDRICWLILPQHRRLQKVCVCMMTYIYIYKERDRDRERERES